MQADDLVIKKELINILQSMDELIYGFGYVGDIAPHNLKHLPYAISIGIPLTRAIADSILSGPNPVYYDEYRSTNDRLDLTTQQLKNEIEKRGYRAYAISSSTRTDFVNIKGEFPHKAAAVRSGLGWIGRSSLLITREYGPRIRLSTLFTDIPLATSTSIEKNACGKCQKCVDACPARAIVGNRWAAGMPREQLIDVKKCDLWKANNFSQFHGQVCGICVAVCPHGYKKGK